MIRFCAIFLFFILISSCSSGPGTVTGKDSVTTITPVFNPESCRDTIAKLETRRSGFIIRGSGDSLLSLYTENAQVLAPGQTIYSGSQSIINYWSNVPVYLQYDRTILTLDGNSGLLYETGIEVKKGRARDGDQEFAGSDKYLVIWKRVDGKWKIASEMWNALPPANSADGD